MESIEPSRNPDPRLFDEQVRLLARQIPALAAGSICLAMGAAYLLVQQGLPVSRVGGWLAAIVGLSLARVALYGFYRRRGGPGGQARQWAGVFCAFSAVAGLAWGSLGVLFPDADDPFTLALVAIILAGILASGISSLGALWRAHLAFGIPCALPFAVRCFIEGGPTFLTLGVLTIFFLVFAEVFALSVERSIRQSLALRLRNEELVASLHEAKERAEAADHAKSKLLAAASHDLRQPLHAMALLAESLGADVAGDRVGPADVAYVAHRMQQDLGVMGELVGRLLDTSRLDAGTIEVRLQPVGLSRVLEPVVAAAGEIARAKGLRLRWHDCEAQVHTDPVLLRSVVTNLVANAIKYTPGGGILVACRPRGARVRVEVWDTGIGIPEEEIGAVFGAYYQASNADVAHRSDKGFGLGLSIVRRLAQLMELPLDVRSRVGKGSVFAVEVPRHALHGAHG